MTKRDADKKNYLLWWEYLKRNEDYKELCELIRSGVPNAKYPDVEKIFRYRGPINEKFKDPKTGYSTPLVNTYFTFDDVHQYGFEIWWQRRIGFNKWERRSPKLVEAYEFREFRAFLKEVMEYVQTTFVSKHGRDPSLDEFKDTFLNQMFVGYTPFVWMKVSLGRGETIEDILHFSKTLLKPVLNSKEVKLRSRYSKRAKELCGDRLRFDEVKRYLDVFDLKQTMTMKEVITRMKGDGYADNLDVHRAFHADLKKAKRIIINAGNGFFPGNY